MIIIKDGYMDYIKDIKDNFLFICVITFIVCGLTSFHTSIIPKISLFYSISRRITISAFVEAIIMEISLALLMESVVRLPKAIGQL